MYSKLLFLLFFSLTFIRPAHSQNNYGVTNGEVTVRLSSDGRITGIRLGKNGPEKKLAAFSSIEGCRQQGNTIMHKEKDGSVECIRTLVNDSLGGACVVTERFIPAGAGIRWELAIKGTGKPWSSPICTKLEYPATAQTRFWTAWGAPPSPMASKDTQLMENLRPVPGGSEAIAFIGKGNNQWTDPLQAIPFMDTVFYYGLPYFTYAHPRTSICPFQGNLFSIPLCSILEVREDAGITLALSPGDDIIDMTLTTQTGGGVLFSRLFNRISADHPVKFSMDIISHEADWRCGLGWMAARYPEYFQPENKHAYLLAGTSAYSSRFDVTDTARLRAMDFSTNWKASFDFPYIGMYLPPVSSDVTWNSLGGPVTSIGQMAAYASDMKKAGFHVLNYFNVTEFGSKIIYPAPPDTIIAEADRWKDCNSFLYHELPGALLLSPVRAGGPVYSWEKSVVMDCGDPVYKDFLLRQALRHIREIPDADGICIDRLDWLRWFNEHADDGKTWFYGQPVRSFLHSFKALMDTLGPMMHGADKSIFVNNHDKRIDILKHADGIFDEFTYAGSPLNLTAFLCVEKAALGWTDTASTVKREGPDQFFQKYLYMGVFPMCPFPANDHSIMPDTMVDRYYIDYAPLLRQLRGREWVLRPHVIRVEKDRAKANLFRTPSGYVIPVVYGKDDRVRVVLKEADIAIKGVDMGAGKEAGTVAGAVKYAVWYPGNDKPLILKPLEKGGWVYLDVPLVRGCGMVAIGGR